MAVCVNLGTLSGTLVGTLVDTHDVALRGRPNAKFTDDIQTRSPDPRVMGYPRAMTVDPDAPGCHHGISRFVHRAWPCGEDSASGRNFDHRRVWIEERLLDLPRSFAFGLYARALMSDHMHVVLRSVPNAAASWSDEQVAMRWARLRRTLDSDDDPAHLRMRTRSLMQVRRITRARVSICRRPALVQPVSGRLQDPADPARDSSTDFEEPGHGLREEAFQDEGAKVLAHRIGREIERQRVRHEGVPFAVAGRSVGVEEHALTVEQTRGQCILRLESARRRDAFVE